MMIEDLYKTTDKLNAHIENMALNKVNIEFLRRQMDKVLTDIEKLKDANREIGYKNGSYASMIETVVALINVCKRRDQGGTLVQTENMAAMPYAGSATRRGSILKSVIVQML